MLCPKCCKPYNFLQEKSFIETRCLRCNHKDTFVQPSYDSYHSHLYVKPYTRTKKTDPQLKEIIRYLPKGKKLKALDLGCGVGDYTQALDKEEYSVVGLDLFIEEAQKKYPGINFRNHDLNMTIPFPDNHFDVLTSINVIEHLVHSDQFLKECFRVLKPKGTIVMMTANLDFILHDYFYDKTHVHEWRLAQFNLLLKEYFIEKVSKKSSSMFNYYPFNFVLVKFLKPDLLFIGTKP